MRRFLEGSLLTILLLACCGCEAKPNQVAFVLPDGFRGGFAIFPDSPDGVVLEQKRGRYVIEIPENGILKINGPHPFASYLSTASFANGDTIWVEKGIDDKPSPGEVRLWGLGTHISYEPDKPINEFWWFVGTDADWDACPNHDSRFKPGRVIKK